MIKEEKEKVGSTICLDKLHMVQKFKCENETENNRLKHGIPL